MLFRWRELLVRRRSVISTVRRRRRMRLRGAIRQHRGQHRGPFDTSGKAITASDPRVPRQRVRRARPCRPSPSASPPCQASQPHQGRHLTSSLRASRVASATVPASAAVASCPRAPNRSTDKHVPTHVTVTVTRNRPDRWINKKSARIPLVETRRPRPPRALRRRARAAAS